MPTVMIKKEIEGHLSCYIAKKDLEEKITEIEFDQEDRWGGNFTLAGGASYFIEPLSAPPKMPITLRAKRAE